MRVLAVLLALVSVVLIAAEPTEDQKKVELKKLEGAWQMATEERDGNSRPVKDKWIIKGDHYTCLYNGSPLATYRISIDTSKKPRQIETFMEMKDFKGKPTEGKPLIGIYEIDGDTLRVCYQFYNHTDTPLGRPDKFAAPKGSNTLLLTLKRVKQ
jgi:uncharacterized protein (TIGR03067 family)